MEINSPIIKIGIIGGGQLGKMMAQEAKKMGFYVQVLDPTPDCPAAQVADRQIVGDFYNEEKIREIVLSSDASTYDIENINTDALKKLVAEGYVIYPSPDLLEIIQDRSKQKKLLGDAGILTARYRIADNPGIFDSCIKRFNFPVVQKACKGGYDGRGVFVVQNSSDVEKTIKAKSIFEEFIDFEKELAMIVVRSINGEIKCYPVVEMTFDKRANICDRIIAPARISENTQEQAKKIGIQCAEALNGVGIFGIEMFLTKDGQVLVNEIAPRPHNSGHYTIEACVTSQFEQHIRAITNLPLGSTELLTPAVMMNILGEEGYEGPATLKGIKEALSIPGVSLHIYGKKVTKPFRKMGHITVVDKDIEKAIERAEKAKSFLKVISSG